MTLTTPTWGTVYHKTHTSQANPRTKFDDSIFSHFRDILRVCETLECGMSHGPDHEHLGDSWSSEGLYR